MWPSKWRICKTNCRNSAASSSIFNRSDRQRVLCGSGVVCAAIGCDTDSVRDFPSTTLVYGASARGFDAHQESRCDSDHHPGNGTWNRGYYERDRKCRKSRVWLDRHHGMRRNSDCRESIFDRARTARSTALGTYRRGDTDDRATSGFSCFAALHQKSTKNYFRIVRGGKYFCATRIVGRVRGVIDKVCSCRLRLSHPPPEKPHLAVFTYTVAKPQATHFNCADFRKIHSAVTTLSMSRKNNFVDQSSSSTGQPTRSVFKRIASGN